MIGAIAGDIIGSPFEFDRPTKSKDFELFSSDSRFTDDTILTIAIADAILNSTDPRQALVDYYKLYPEGGFGKLFKKWAAEGGKDAPPSFGNGAAMRICPVAYAFRDTKKALEIAEKISRITHSHEQAILGAKAVVLAIHHALNGISKSNMRQALEDETGYDLSRKLRDIRPNYKFTAESEHSVPEAIIAFLESESYEDAVRNAISLGGDADTQACIAGAIAEAYYGVPNDIASLAMNHLDSRLQKVTRRFMNRYCS